MTQSLAYYVTWLRRDFTEYCGRRLQEVGLSQGLLFFIQMCIRDSSSPKLIFW